MHMWRGHGVGISQNHGPLLGKWCFVKIIDGLVLIFNRLVKPCLQSSLSSYWMPRSGIRISCRFSGQPEPLISLGPRLMVSVKARKLEQALANARDPNFALEPRLLLADRIGQSTPGTKFQVLAYKNTTLRF